MRLTRRAFGAAIAAGYAIPASFALAQTSTARLRADVTAALKRAATFYHDRVAVHGGYGYYSSVDLQQRWGEGRLDPQSIVVQPPGTPTVGEAYLKAFAATRDAFYLDAARDAALALVEGQLQSGGWTQVIDFVPHKQSGNYRTRRGGSRNSSSLDDNQTQSALKLLMHADQALEFKHAQIREAAKIGLDALLKAQFLIGAFPQVWTGPVSAQPAKRAHYPDYDWRSEGRLKEYWNYYTLNDGLAGTVAEVLIEAERVYGDVRYLAALVKLGEFLLAAQMPDPQPGWCQQYNYEMVPIWARKFEPPAVTGWESQDVMETLIRIGRHTGEKRFLEPIPRAIAYFRGSLLADGRVARYYELRTNKPLYMDESYQLTYDADAAPKHYGWTQAARFDVIEQAYESAQRGEVVEQLKDVEALARQAQEIVAALDDEGRWISKFAGEPLVGQPKFPAGFEYLSSAIFSRNVETLSAYLTATA